MPDFTSEHTVCPQCNSDLKPFFLLKSISNSHPKNLMVVVSIVTVLVLIVFAFLYFRTLSENDKIKLENIKSVQAFQDSLQTLQNIISLNSQNLSVNYTSEKETVIHYIVKSGDNTSKIAQFFFNDWKMYKKIEADNNLIHPYILQIGQPLTIKIKQ